MRRVATLAAGILAMVAGVAIAHADPVKVQFWHSMSGGLGDGVKEVVRRFNESQDQCLVEEAFKGKYEFAFNAVVAAYRAGEHPHMFQNHENSVLTMLLSDAIVPVEDLLAKQGISVDFSGYLPPVIDTYTGPDGKLLAMPFNSSTPIMYYNEELLEKAGFDAPAATWQEMEAQIKTAQSKGVTRPDGSKVCGFAFNAHPWDQVENWSAVHAQPLATKENGRQGLDAELIFNKTALVGQMERMKRWIDEGYAEFGAQSAVDWSSGARTNFHNGNCMYYSFSTAMHAAMEANNKFRWSATFLPYDEKVVEKPLNSTIGGAAIWVLKGFEEPEYACVAKFFGSLTSVDTQKYWHKQTGYVPITKAAYEDLKEEGYYREFPSKEIAILQLLRPGGSKVPRLGNYNNVRDALSKELEKAWNGSQTIQQALDEAVRRGNEVIRRFEKQNAGKL